MTKKDLIEFVIASCDVCRNKAQAEQVIATVFDAVRVGLMADGEFKLSGFGSFKIKHYKARTARNPKTGEKVEVGARKSVYFKPSKVLKEQIAK